MTHRNRYLKDCPTTVSIDVSGSTEGLVRRLEISDSRTIYSLLEEAAPGNSYAVPWSNKPKDHLSLRHVDRISRSGGGTAPTTMLTEPNLLLLKERTDLWFLFTDGMIDTEEEVKKFAETVYANSLHNLPCVVVVFGDQSSNPTQCDISVGQALISRAPNSIFLYRDTSDQSATLFIFEARGSFDQFYVRKGKDKRLNRNSKWNDLNKTTYQELFSISAIRKTSLEPYQLMLHDHTTIDISRLNRGVLGHEEVTAVFASNTNLKYLVLNARNSGQEQELNVFVLTNRRSPALERTVDPNAQRIVKAIAYHELRDLTRAREVLQDLHTRAQRDFTNRLLCDNRAVSRDRAVLSVTQRLYETIDNHSARLFEPIVPSDDQDPLRLLPQLLAIKWYQIPTDTERFKGTCPICDIDSGRRPLCLLIQVCASVTTIGEAVATLRAIKDRTIISDLICCDACGEQLIGKQSADGTHTFKTAVPLIRHDAELNNKAQTATLVRGLGQLTDAKKVDAVWNYIVGLTLQHHKAILQSVVDDVSLDEDDTNNVSHAQGARSEFERSQIMLEALQWLSGMDSPTRDRLASRTVQKMPISTLEQTIPSPLQFSASTIQSRTRDTGAYAPTTQQRTTELPSSPLPKNPSSTYQVTSGSSLQSTASERHPADPHSMPLPSVAPSTRSASLDKPYPHSTVMSPSLPSRTALSARRAIPENEKRAVPKPSSESIFMPLPDSSPSSRSTRPIDETHTHIAVTKPPTDHRVTAENPLQKPSRPFSTPSPESFSPAGSRESLDDPSSHSTITSPLHSLPSRTTSSTHRVTPKTQKPAQRYLPELTSTPLPRASPSTRFSRHPEDPLTHPTAMESSPRMNTQPRSRNSTAAPIPNPSTPTRAPRQPNKAPTHPTATRPPRPSMNAQPQPRDSDAAPLSNTSRYTSVNEPYTSFTVTESPSPPINTQPQP